MDHDSKDQTNTDNTLYSKNKKLNKNACRECISMCKKRKQYIKWTKSEDLVLYYDEAI